MHLVKNKECENRRPIQHHSHYIDRLSIQPRGLTYSVNIDGHAYKRGIFSQLRWPKPYTSCLTTIAASYSSLATPIYLLDPSPISSTRSQRPLPSRILIIILLLSKQAMPNSKISREPFKSSAKLWRSALKKIILPMTKKMIRWAILSMNMGLKTNHAKYQSGRLLTKTT